MPEPEINSRLTMISDAERMSDMETGNPLKRWRLDSGKSGQEAAEHIGVTLPMWWRWENGTRQVPANRVLDIEAKTGVSRHVLRPDVFGLSGEAA